MTEKRQITWIDSLKGIATCGVVLIHSGGIGLPGILGKIGALGARFPQMFFILSAYLAFKALENSQDGRAWVCRKMLRLIPCYYLMLIISTSMGGNIYWLGSQEKITVGNFIAHILFIHGLFPEYTNSIIGVEWYLGVLALFYFVAPFLRKVITGIEKAFGVMVMSILGSTLLSGLIWELYVYLDCESHVYRSYVESFSIIAQLPSLAIGIFLYYLFEVLKDIEIEHKKLLAWSILLFSMVMLVGSMYDLNILWGVSAHTLFSIWFGGIVLSQFVYSPKLINNIVFQYIGKHSYGIYLLHYAILLYCDKYIELEMDNILWTVVKFFSSIVMSLLLAKILSFMYEKPVIKKVEKFLLN